MLEGDVELVQVRLNLGSLQVLKDQLRRPGLKGQQRRIELLLSILRRGLLNLFVAHDRLDGRVRVVHQELIDGLNRTRLRSALLSSLLVIGGLVTGLSEYLLVNQHHQVFLALRVLIYLRFSE